VISRLRGERVSSLIKDRVFGEETYKKWVLLLELFFSHLKFERGSCKRMVKDDKMKE
jgi:hypothetical protein